MEKEKNYFESESECECGGQTQHLFTTEDEDSVYKFYKCKRCGDMQNINIRKY